MEIRLAIASDIDAIMDILNESIQNDVARFDHQIETKESMSKWFYTHGDKFPVYVACIDGKVVGWASISPYSSRCGYKFTVENSIYIHKDHRGKGIGDQLFATLIEATRKLGYRSIISLIVSTNNTSIKLHEKYGFVTVGQMKEVGYKFGQWLDVVIMQCML